MTVALIRGEACVVGTGCDSLRSTRWWHVHVAGARLLHLEAEAAAGTLAEAAAAVLQHHDIGGPWTLGGGRRKREAVCPPAKALLLMVCVRWLGVDGGVGDPELDPVVERQWRVGSQWRAANKLQDANFSVHLYSRQIKSEDVQLLQSA
jgi:hypothetical protein